MSTAGKGKLPRIALTSGEPAGIGPDLCLAIAQRSLSGELVCIADRQLLAERARQLGLSIELRDYSPSDRRAHQPGSLTVLHVPLGAPCTPGQLDVRNARYVLQLLDRAIEGCQNGEWNAIVTAPVQKSVINDAGVPFTGHTEYLAERTQALRPVMMLTTGPIRVALATTHLPLKDVSAALTQDVLCEVIEILDRDLRRSWGLRQPRIAVCGLNPHAGESGHLGDEEIRVISPAIARMRERGIHLTGPVPADTIFVPGILKGYDAVLAMYHDQGLPVVKHAGFDHAVNVTLGLPIVRTSVDHGTALDLAGTGRAQTGSLEAAVHLAVEMAQHHEVNASDHGASPAGATRGAR
jgi:4-hydroxythreonine-4-phosphate dehydrogenase